MATITFRLSDEEKERLEERAHEEGVSVSGHLKKIAEASVLLPLEFQRQLEYIARHRHSADEEKFVGLGLITEAILEEAIEGLYRKAKWEDAKKIGADKRKFDRQFDGQRDDPSSARTRLGYALDAMPYDE